MSTVSNSIRQVLGQDILKQESGNQATFVSKLFNCFTKCGWEEYDSKRFVAEYKTNEGRADIVDTVANVVWEMKSSTLDIDSTHGTHAGKQDLNPYQQALGYCRSLGYQNFVVTNGRQFRLYLFKDGSVKLLHSFDNFGNDLSDEDLVAFIGEAFKGSTIDIALVRMIRNLDTKLDEELDKSDRKTCAAYWSNITKARALFRQSPFYKSVAEQMQQATTADALWAVWKRITSVKIFDPSVGGCALLVAAHAELCDLERRIERRLSFDFDQDTDPFVNVLPIQFYGIEMYDTQFAESLNIAGAARKLFDSFGAFKEKNQKRYNLMQADALEVSWREFVGAGEVVIFANPPFTYGKNLNDAQRAQCKKYKVSHFDSCFMIKAAQEGMYGTWIVNSSITINDGKELDKYCHTVPGEIYGADIISNGGKTERWMHTSEGTGGNIGDLRSRVMLTNWAEFDGTSGFPCKEDITGELTCTYSGRQFKCTGYYECDTDKDYILPQKTYQATWTPIKPALPRVTGNLILKNPTDWTLKAVQSRAFFVWSLVLEASTVWNGRSWQCTPTNTRSINTFPLFQGDDLDHYDSMSDEEIFQELYQKYQALIKK